MNNTFTSSSLSPKKYPHKTNCLPMHIGPMVPCYSLKNYNNTPQTFNNENPKMFNIPTNTTKKFLK